LLHEIFIKLLPRHVSASVLGHLQGARHFFYTYEYCSSCVRLFGSSFTFV